MAENYIPGPDGKFDEFLKVIVNYVDLKTGGNKPEWNHIPPDALEEFHGAWNDWSAAYEPTKVPHTPVQTAEKRRVRKRTEKTLRTFVNRFLRYPPVTDEDRDNMGIPNKKGKGSRVQVPDTSPLLIVDTSTRRRIRIFYKDEKSLRRGKPKGVHGIEVRWEILDHPPESIKELTQSGFDTNPPLTLNFDEMDRGKHVYMSGSWEIEREGEKGPPGPIIEVVIP
jgi:hypothetical protein